MCCRPTALVETECGCAEVVDDNDQTSVPNIFAIGDALDLSNGYGQQELLQGVARLLAAEVCEGKPELTPVAIQA